ncbi:MAG: hypothetical protein R6W69_09795, partial [Anaerolineales bacterium]
GLGFLVLTRLISEIASLLAQPIYQSLQFLDADGSFLYLSIHHIWQGLFAFLAILLLSRIFRISFSDFGFNLNEWRYSVRLVLQFCLFWFFVQGVMGYLMVSSGGQSALLSFLDFPLTAWNVGGYLAFQFLLSGTSCGRRWPFLFSVAMISSLRLKMCCMMLHIFSRNGLCQSGIWRGWPRPRGASRMNCRQASKICLRDFDALRETGAVV